MKGYIFFIEINIVTIVVLQLYIVVVKIHITDYN